MTAGHRFVVAAIGGDNKTVYMQPLTQKYIPPLGTLVKISDSSTYVSTEIISTPLVNKYSGALLLTCNETPFTFTAEQNIALKTYIKL
jgi:hypothetical protein